MRKLPKACGGPVHTHVSVIGMSDLAKMKERGGGPGARGGRIYRIAGETLHTRYRDAQGNVLLDQVDVGAAPRRAVLGSYFAPRSDFRRPLIRSLLR
ncbi:MAG: hypothetical protein ACREMQ_08145 [Longimicrobiales bacterium]